MLWIWFHDNLYECSIAQQHRPPFAFWLSICEPTLIQPKWQSMNAPALRLVLRVVVVIGEFVNSFETDVLLRILCIFSHALAHMRVNGFVYQSVPWSVRPSIAIFVDIADFGSILSSNILSSLLLFWKIHIFPFLVVGMNIKSNFLLRQQLILLMMQLFERKPWLHSTISYTNRVQAT